MYSRLIYFGDRKVSLTFPGDIEMCPRLIYSGDRKVSLTSLIGNVARHSRFYIKTYSGGVE